MSENGRSRLLRSLASSWLALGVGIGISFFLSPFVVNKLGAGWYGVWAVAAQFTGYLFLLDFGVRESVVRYTSKYVAKRQAPQLSRVLSTAILLYGGITVLTLLATGIVVWGMPHWFSLDEQYWRDARIAMAYTGATIASTFLFNVFTGIMMGLRKWEITNAIGIGLNVLRSALIVVFLWRGHGIVALAGIQFFVGVFSGLLTAVMALVMLRKCGMTFRFAALSLRRYRAFARRIFGYGFYVIVNNVGEKLIATTDAIIVGIFLPIASVAYYAIGSSLVSYMRSLLGSTAQLFNPLTSHLHAVGQRGSIAPAFMFGAKINLLVTLPIATVFVLLGERFIGLWMGAEFAAPAGQVLAILSITSVLSAPQWMFSSVLYGLSRHRLIAALRVVEGVVNLGLSIVLVQIIGLPGVALGTAIPSIIIVMFVLPVMAARVIGLDLRRYYFEIYVRPALAILPVAGLAYWMRVHWPSTNLIFFFGQVALLCVAYLPCAFALILSAPERAQIVRRLHLPAILAGHHKA